VICETATGKEAAPQNLGRIKDLLDNIFHLADTHSFPKQPLNFCVAVKRFCAVPATLCASVSFSVLVCGFLG
jgi:hypothetical protein